MNKTFAYITNVDGWLAAIAPYYLPCLPKVLLIVSKDNEIIKGRDGATARRKGQVRGFSPLRAVIRRRHVEAKQIRTKGNDPSRFLPGS